MAWVRQPDGKWVDDSAPARVQRPLPDAPAARVGQLDAMTAEFSENPFAFLQKNPMIPPHSSGQGDFGAKLAHNALDPSAIVEGASDNKITLLQGGGRRFVQVIPSQDRPGVTTLKFVKDGLTNGTTIPIYWLPWQTLKIVRSTIPPVPNNLYNPSDIDFPRIFVTAGINGCSVFIQGTPEKPTISHAGIDGKLRESATTFWREQMGILSPGALRGEVSTKDYMKGAYLEGQVKQYVDWLNKDSDKTARIVLMSPFACVFGVRHGRGWTFYLQKSVMTMRCKLYKELQVRKEGNRYVAKDTGQAVEFMENRREHQHVLGKATPWMVNKKTFREFIGTRSAKTMIVGEIFPRRLISTDLRDEWRLDIR